MLPLNRLDELHQRLSFLIKQRRRWASHNKITCFRLYDEDVFPFIIDVYEDRLVWYVLDDGEIEESELEQVISSSLEVLSWDPGKLYVKFRRRQIAGARYGRLDEKEQLLTVHEGGLKFQINLTDYLDTGLFLDHRWTRSYVRALAAGRRVLNLFCYTGSFTVYAIAGGAFETTSVDLNANYLNWAERNLELNSQKGPNHRFLRRDVVEYLRTETRKTWDLIILDPPTFSQSKKMDSPLDIQRDAPLLIQNCLKILSPDGVLIFSNNYQKFRLEPRLFPKAKILPTTDRTLPRDFHRGTHQSWFITHLNAQDIKLVNLDLGNP
ncbi:MAG: hypothetical protein HKM06_01245 [Spirochaetales bacterium]|nr:hypothetical protein [Spirochaetales bacterium]